MIFARLQHFLMKEIIHRKELSILILVQGETYLNILETIILHFQRIYSSCYRLQLFLTLQFCISMIAIFEVNQHGHYTFDLQISCKYSKKKSLPLKIVHS